MPTPLINGVNYSFVNITLVLFGVPVVGITKIDYKRKQKKENNYAGGTPYPVSRGYGLEEYEGSIEMYVDEWKQIIRAAPNRNPLQIAPFDVQIVYGGSGVTADKDVLRMCEFTEDPFDGKTGETKLLVNIPLIIGGIDR